MFRKSRRTRQKERIESTVKEIDGFFTAEDLHERLAVGGKIGIATVYRSLKSLSQRGKIHSYVCSRRKIYSRIDNNHCHFTCRECGKTTHFKLKNIDFIKLIDAGETCHFQLDVHGVCKTCRESGF